MSASASGVYTYSKITETHPNTQDNTQTAWPRWTPGVVESATVTTTYQEGAWAIWGPEAATKEYVIKDDLVTKYNFQEYNAAERSAKSAAPLTKWVETSKVEEPKVEETKVEGTTTRSAKAASSK